MRVFRGEIIKVLTTSLNFKGRKNKFGLLDNLAVG